MTVRLTPWHRAVARVAILAAVVALMPLPVLAAETSQPAKASSLQTSIAKNVANEVARSTAAAARQAQQAGKTDKAVLDSPSFFKTPAGMIAIAIVAAGTGYAIYSWKHDRIHSVARAGQ